MSQEEIKVTFLDVGQGDSTVIILPDSTTAIVVDCPNDPSAFDYLEAKMINRISHVVLTHTDEDHLGGMPDLLTNFLNAGNTVNVVALSYDKLSVTKNRKLLLRRLVDLVNKHNIKFISPRTGDSWVEQGVTLNVLHPDSINLLDAQLSDRPNNASITLKVAFAGKHILLTGDLEGKAWKWIVDRQTNLQADILKFPHHGAWYDAKQSEPSLNQILEMVNPSFVVLSVGSDNSYGHPHPETIKLLCSFPSVAFAHTQPTAQCYSVVASRRGSFACSGSVEFAIGQDDIKVIP